MAKKKPLIAIAVVAAVILLVACYRYCDCAHDDVEKVPRLHGRTLDEVVAELGKADHTYSFTMDASLGEFQIELYNFYPPGRPGNADVRIRESHWQHSDYTLTVWSHEAGGKWVVLDTCRWKKGVVF